MANEFQPRIIIDPFSLLVVNSRGELKRLHCPFLARCMIPDEGLIRNEVYVVEIVKAIISEEINFVISGKTYSHHRFQILM